MDNNSIYKFNVQTLNGEEIGLSAYKNKVLLIVNTASQCGFTPQLKDLALLKDQFKDKDFEILAFPSNDFGGQEPLEGKAIEEFCDSYGANFPTFEKIRVRGPYAHPLYKFLSSKKETGKLTTVPRWNFHKYLIGPDGELAGAWPAQVAPTDPRITSEVERLLAPGSQ